MNHRPYSLGIPGREKISVGGERDSQPQSPTRKVNSNTFSFFLSVLLFFPLLLVVLPSSPVGSFFSLFVGWWWCCCFFSAPFGGVAFLPLRCVELLLSSLLLGGAAWVRPSLGGVAFPSSFAWCCFPFPPSGSVLFSSLRLGGAAWFPSFGWCCLFSSSFFLLFASCLPLLWVGLLFPCLLLGGASCPTPSWGGVALPLSFLRGAAFSSFGWCCCFSFFCWVVLLGLLLWVVFLFSCSTGWRCLVSSLFVVCCCPKSKRKDARSKVIGKLKETLAKWK